MQKRFVHEHPKDSTNWEMLETQSLVSDPSVHSIDGPMCRWSLKARGSIEKAEFMRKQTRWITSSKEIAEVLRGDGRWKRDRRHVHMTGKSETACEYPASLVAAMLSAIKRQMISDGAIRIGEMHFAGPVPDDGDCPTELEGKWRVDGMWVDPKLLIAGRREEMEYMRKMGAFEVVDEKRVLRQRLQTSQTEMGGQDERREMPFKIGLSRDKKRAKDRDEQLGPDDVFSPTPPSEGLKMLVSTMMTGHVDGNHVDGPFEMATWDVSRAHFYGDARRWIYTYLPEGHEQKGELARLCRRMYGTRDAASIWGDTWSEVLKESSMKVGTACPAFFCSCDGDFKGLCHGDDFCVVARRKQLQTFANLWKSP